MNVPKLPKNRFSLVMMITEKHRVILGFLWNNTTDNYSKQNTVGLFTGIQGFLNPWSFLNPGYFLNPWYSLNPGYFLNPYCKSRASFAESGRNSLAEETSVAVIRTVSRTLGTVCRTFGHGLVSSLRFKVAFCWPPANNFQNTIVSRFIVWVFVRLLLTFSIRNEFQWSGWSQTGANHCCLYRIRPGVWGWQ